MYLYLDNVGWSLIDTGFGNRMQFWEYAYELNRRNDFNFKMAVEERMWAETKYLNFPYTETIDEYFDDYLPSQNLPSIDPRLPFKTLDVNKSYNILGEWPPYMGEKLESCYGKWVHLITLKDKIIENKIKNLVKDRIGIHVRHWPVLENINHDIPVERFDYKGKMKLLRETMDKYPNSKFYMSTDCTYDKPGQTPPLPDFRKESHWISEIYKDYDVVDYRDILDVSKVVSNTFPDIDNNGWKMVLDDEGTPVKEVRIFHGDAPDNFFDKYAPSTEDLKIHRDCVDLFGLIYSKKFINSNETGPGSSWSDFVLFYRQTIWQE
jgi:hypothetical protein